MKSAAVSLLLVFLVSSIAIASGANEKDKKQKSIVMVVPLDTTSWSDNMRTGITAFGKDHADVQASQTGGTTADPATQSGIVEDLIGKGVNAILAVPADPPMVAAALNHANDAGITTVTIGAPRLQHVSCDVEAFDVTELGRHAVDVMAAWMNFSGAWQPLIGHRSSPTDTQWLDGATAQVRAAYPGLTMSGDAREDLETPQVAHDTTMELVKAHPELKAITGSTTSSVLGAAQAISELGLAGKVGVFGNCLPSLAGDSIRSGVIIAIWFWVPADAGYVTARAAYELLKGRTITAGMDMGRPGFENVTVKTNDFGVPVIYGRAWVDVTKDNLKDWINPDGKYKL